MDSIPETVRDRPFTDDNNYRMKPTHRDLCVQVDTQAQVTAGLAGECCEHSLCLSSCFHIFSSFSCNDSYSFPCSPSLSSSVSF